MFAFAVLDQESGSLFLARDQFGIKPLHFIRRKDGVVFASELKALVAAFGSELDMLPRALVASMLYYWVPDQMCSVKGVEKLQPGTWAEFRPDGTHRVERYWDIVEEASAAQGTHYDLKEVVEDSVRAHLVADVPVSSFLSGGLDSSIVTVLAKQANPQIDAYTITFRAEDNRLEAMPDDAMYARKVAQLHGIDLHEIELQPDVVDLLPRMVDILDEPIGDPAAINTLLMSQAARDAGVKVLLSGMGADELFGGYRKHVACMLAGRYRELPAFVHRSTNGVVDRLPLTAAGRGIRYSRWAKRFVTFAELPEEAAFRRSYSLYDPAELASFLSPELQPDVDDVVEQHLQVYEDNRLSDGVNRMCLADTRLFLPGLNLAYTDRASMAASTEVRVPFVDPDGLPGRVLPVGQGQGLWENRKSRTEACRRGMAPEGDRPPTEGVLFGSAPGVGVSGSPATHRRLVARRRARQHGFPPPASRHRSCGRAPGGHEKIDPNRSGSCSLSRRGIARPVKRASGCDANARKGIRRPVKQVAQNYRSGALDVIDAPAPSCAPGGVLVRSLYSLISTGTELMKVGESKLSLVGKARARPDQVKKVLENVQQQGALTTYKKAMNRLDSYSPLGYSLAGVVQEVGRGG